MTNESQKERKGEIDLKPAQMSLIADRAMNSVRAEEIVREWKNKGGGAAVVSASDGEKFEFRYSSNENKQDLSRIVRTQHRINVYHNGENIGFVNFTLEKNKAAHGQSWIKLFHSFDKDNQVMGRSSIRSIFVGEQYRYEYQGIGTSLMAFLMYLARLESVTGISVAQVEAPGFFESLGFEYTVSRNMIFLFDKKWMEKRHANFPEIAIENRHGSQGGSSKSIQADGAMISEERSDFEIMISRVFEEIKNYNLEPDDLMALQNAGNVADLESELIRLDDKHVIPGLLRKMEMLKILDRLRFGFNKQMIPKDKDMSNTKGRWFLDLGKDTVTATSGKLRTQIIEELAREGVGNEHNPLELVNEGGDIGLRWRKLDLSHWNYKIVDRLTLQYNLELKLEAKINSTATSTDRAMTANIDARLAEFGIPLSEIQNITQLQYQSDTIVFKGSILNRNVIIKILNPNSNERLGIIEHEVAVLKDAVGLPISKYMPQLLGYHHVTVKQAVQLNGVTDEGFRVGQSYFVEQLEEGQIPGRQMENLPLHSIEPVAINELLPLVEALRELNMAGFFHRDLDVNEIRLLPDGQVKILDWGFAESPHVKLPGRFRRFVKELLWNPGWTQTYSRTLRDNRRRNLFMVLVVGARLMFKIPKGDISQPDEGTPPMLKFFVTLRNSMADSGGFVRLAPDFIWNYIISELQMRKKELADDLIKMTPKSGQVWYPKITHDRQWATIRFNIEQQPFLRFGVNNWRNPPPTCYMPLRIIFPIRMVLWMSLL